MFRPRGNVSIDNEQERFTIICGGGGVWECGSVGVGPGNKRNLLLRAYQPLCGEMERDVGEETGVVIVRMNCYCCLSGFSSANVGCFLLTQSRNSRVFVLIFHGIISTSQPQHSAIKTFLFLKTTMSNFRNRVLVLQFYVRVRERTRRSQNLQLSLENYIKTSHFVVSVLNILYVKPSRSS